MNEKTRIPVTILTGFLGSGKTTLLNRILKEAHGKRIAVIENELGEVSIDDALLVDTQRSVFKMSNGCLCCTINGDLIQTLTDLVERRAEFDFVIVETTGIANPAPVLQTFVINEDIAEVFKIDAVVTLVDAKHIGHHIGTKECQDQVAFADIIVLNKVDLAIADEVAFAERQIRRLNVLADVHKACRSTVDLACILDQNAFSREIVIATCKHEHVHGHDCHDDHGTDHDLADGHLDHHHHDDNVQSAGFTLAGRLDRGRFNRWFGELIRTKGDTIYRCKGILSFSDTDDRVIVQTVHRVSEVTSGGSWGDEARTSKIVFIGQAIDRSELFAGLNACVVN